MVGSSVGLEAPVASNGSLVNGKSVDRLPSAAEQAFDPTVIVSEAVPPVVEDGESTRKIVLGKNVHTTCLEVTEPDADDESTGDKDAYMASVLARYRKTLLERTKHHLGMIVGFYDPVFAVDLEMQYDVFFFFFSI